MSTLCSHPRDGHKIPKVSILADAIGEPFIYWFIKEPIIKFNDIEFIQGAIYDNL